MLELLIALLILLTNPAQQPPPDCGPAISIVQNGLDAFAAGTLQIGPFTDPNAYLVAGQAYIFSYCGDIVSLDIFRNRP